MKVCSSCYCSWLFVLCFLGEHTQKHITDASIATEDFVDLGCFAFSSRHISRLYQTEPTYEHGAMGTVGWYGSECAKACSAMESYTYSGVVSADRGRCICFNSILDMSKTNDTECECLGTGLKRGCPKRYTTFRVFTTCPIGYFHPPSCRDRTPDMCQLFEITGLAETLYDGRCQVCSIPEGHTGYEKCENFQQNTYQFDFTNWWEISSTYNNSFEQDFVGNGQGLEGVGVMYPSLQRWGTPPQTTFYLHKIKAILMAAGATYFSMWIDKGSAGTAGSNVTELYWKFLMNAHKDYTPVEYTNLNKHVDIDHSAVKVRLGYHTIDTAQPLGDASRQTRQLHTGIAALKFPVRKVKDLDFILQRNNMEFDQLGVDAWRPGKRITVTSSWTGVGLEDVLEGDPHTAFIPLKVEFLSPCPRNCAKGKCSEKFICTYGCLGGYVGKFCDVECPEGTYGHQCDPCNKNCNEGTCSKTTGTCTEGCLDGKMGAYCDEICPPGMYGARCSSPCSDHCSVPRDCNRFTGECMSGECAAGYIPPLCLDPCPGNSFGPGCNRTCGFCMDNAICDSVTGFCPGECEGSFQPPDCNCLAGTWGENCTMPCGSCTANSPCHPVSGNCPGSGADYGGSGKPPADIPDAIMDTIANALKNTKSGISPDVLSDALNKLQSSEFANAIANALALGQESIDTDVKPGGYLIASDEDQGFSRKQFLLGMDFLSDAVREALARAEGGSLTQEDIELLIDLLTKEVLLDLTSKLNTGTYDFSEGKGFGEIWDPDTICGDENLQPPACLCDKLKYGPGCSLRCGHCSGDFCGVDGKCPFGCEPGYLGETCGEICPDGQFGLNCTEACGNCMMGMGCDLVTGECPTGCAVGYKEPFCVTCLDRSFGDNCEFSCGLCKNMIDCDPNGLCKIDDEADPTDACEDGYEPPECKCQLGMYGESCGEVCGRCWLGCLSNGTCYGGCLPGFYGDKCETPCPFNRFGANCQWECGHCYLGTGCKGDTGECYDVCDPGYNPPDCQCPAGFFGEECRYSCGSCKGNVCGYQDGSCLIGCESGFKPPMCVCQIGMYGYHCDHPCGHCLLGLDCDIVNGTCPSGCLDGFQPPHCSELCPVHLYGPACSLVCGHCRDCTVCDPIDGTCPGACEDGYKMPYCVDLCDGGTYGNNCTMECGHCIGGDWCSTGDGFCDNGCEMGYISPLCQEACPPGKWGFNCQMDCGRCANNTVCNYLDGLCQGGECEPDYTPPFCTDYTPPMNVTSVCPPGWYIPPMCDMPCGHCLKQMPCNGVTGFCEAGCDQGYEPLLCHEECPLGRFGYNCVERCGNCAGTTGCSKTDGVCPFGCEDNWFGDNCKYQSEDAVVDLMDSAATRLLKNFIYVTVAVLLSAM